MMPPLSQAEGVSQPVPEESGGGGEPLERQNQLVEEVQGNMMDTAVQQRTEEMASTPFLFGGSQHQDTSTNAFNSSQLSVSTGGSKNGENSQQRKRSRAVKPANQQKEKTTGNSSLNSQTLNVEQHLKQLQAIFDSIITRGDKPTTEPNKAAIRQMALESLKNANMEFALCLSMISNLSGRLLNAQDERNALQQQVIELQTALAQQTAAGGHKMPYLAAVMKNTAASSVAEGRQLPTPTIPINTRHAPAERIILFKATEKKEQLSKQEQEQFRGKIKEVLGVVNMQSIEVIRPTRAGGHTIIFSSEVERDKALEKLRQNEQSRGIIGKMSNLVAPKKQKAKAYCRVPPAELMPEELLQDFYGRNNPQLSQVPAVKREAKIIKSQTMGWIFELSNAEAAALDAQGGCIRYGCGHEIHVEEFIPLQQCYKCCAFGHNAEDCTTEEDLCRLCATVGHAGRECPCKEEKDKWRCVNCIILNEKKGYNLPTDHAAAQLHKCPFAIHQKAQKKLQLMAAGVFTTPMIGETLIQSKEQEELRKKGALDDGKKRDEKSRDYNLRSRSKSIRGSRKLRGGILKNNINNQSKPSATVPISSETESTRPQQRRNYPAVNTTQASEASGTQRKLSNISRTTRTQRPISADGWTTVTRRSNESRYEGWRGRKVGVTKEGTNSTSSLGNAIRRDQGLEMEDHTQDHD